MSTIKTNTIQPTQAGNNLVFTNGTAVEKMRITDGGLVGIGTASPTVLLDVAGAISTYGDVKLTGPGALLSLAYQSNSDNYRGILGWNTLQLGNNGENRIVAGNTVVGGCLNFFVNNTTPLLTNSTPSNGIMAMSILPDGSLQIGEDGNAIAVAQPTTITRHHLFTQGSGIIPSGMTPPATQKQTAINDIWLIGEFTLGAPGDNTPMHCEMIVSQLVTNNIETTTYNFGANYGGGDAVGTGWSSWCTLPVTHCSRYSTVAESQQPQMRFDVRKKLQGNVQIRMRCEVAGLNYTVGHPTNITFRTVASSAVKFIPAATGSAGAAVVATPQNGGSDGVGVVSATAAYAGRAIYEFPIGDQFKPTANGMFINAYGNVGIGKTPSYQLELSTNSAAKPTSSAWTVSSDARLKTVLGNWERGLEDVCRLRPVKYRLNGKYGTTDDGKEHVSVIAQEAAQVIPEMVGTFSGSETPESDPVTLYNLDTNCLQWCFVNAIKELKAIVEAQATRIAALEGN